MALNKWGVEAQIHMMFEEMAELQKELCKYFRGRKSHDEIISEMVDVDIMLNQMKAHFVTTDADVEYFNGQYEYKLGRLEERLDER